MWGFPYFLKSTALGVGLAADAFSVSVANGMAQRCACRNRAVVIAATFAIFQAVMPLIGWACVSTALSYFTVLEKFIPWIALFLLGIIGGKMIWEGAKGEGEEATCFSFGGLMVQGVATSIDALSVGFTIASYSVWEALVCAGIIAAVTFILCYAGVFIGRKFGDVLAGKSTLIGGVILVIIGLQVFLKGIL